MNATRRAHRTANKGHSDFRSSQIDTADDCDTVTMTSRCHDDAASDRVACSVTGCLDNEDAMMTFHRTVYCREG